MSSRRRTATNTDANSMDLTLHGTYMVNFPGSDGSPDWWAAEFVALVDAGYKFETGSGQSSTGVGYVAIVAHSDSARRIRTVAEHRRLRDKEEVTMATLADNTRQRPLHSPPQRSPDLRASKITATSAGRGGGGAAAAEAPGSTRALRRSRPPVPPPRSSPGTRTAPAPWAAAGGGDGGGGAPGPRRPRSPRPRSRPRGSPATPSPDAKRRPITADVVDSPPALEDEEQQEAGVGVAHGAALRGVPDSSAASPAAVAGGAADADGEAGGGGGVTLQLFSAAIPEVLPDVAPPSAVGAAERLLAPVLVALVKEGPMPLTPSQLKERAHLPESTPDDVIV